MYSIGAIVGGSILIYLLSALIEWAVIKRVMNDPKIGVLVAVALATGIAIILAGLGNADGGPFNPGEMALPYLIAGAIVGAIRFFIRARRAAKDPAG